MTEEQIREAVINHVFECCMEDGDYLWNVIVWAHRDYTAQDYYNDFLQMQENAASDAASYT
jgi:hypothetical protein